MSYIYLNVLITFRDNKKKLYLINIENSKIIANDYNFILRATVVGTYYNDNSHILYVLINSR